MQGLESLTQACRLLLKFDFIDQRGKEAGVQTSAICKRFNPFSFSYIFCPLGNGCPSLCQSWVLAGMNQKQIWGLIREHTHSSTSSIQVSWKAGGKTYPVSAYPAALGLIQDCHSPSVQGTVGCSAPRQSLKLYQLFHIHPPLLLFCPATVLAFF